MRPSSLHQRRCKEVRIAHEHASRGCPEAAQVVDPHVHAQAPHDGACDPSVALPGWRLGLPHFFGRRPEQETERHAHQQRFEVMALSKSAFMMDRWNAQSNSPQHLWCSFVMVAFGHVAEKKTPNTKKSTTTSSPPSPSPSS